MGKQMGIFFSLLIGLGIVGALQDGTSIPLGKDLKQNIVSNFVNEANRALQTAEGELDFSVINDILSNVEIVFPTDNFDIERQSQGFPGGSVEVLVQVGGRDKLPGSCNSVSLNGTLGVLGEEQENLNGLQRQKFSVAGSGLKITCVIPLRIIVDKLRIGPLPVNLGGIQGDQEGTFEIEVVDGISWSQELTVLSPDFTTTPPTEAIVGNCTFDAGNLRIDAREVLRLFDDISIDVPLFGEINLGSGINLDGVVERQLRDDSSLITDPLTGSICNLSRSGAESLGELMTFNPFTNVGPDSILQGGGFFDADGNGVLDAIDRERSITNGIENTTLNLITGNFFINTLFPQGGGQEENVLTQFLDSFELGGQIVQQNDAVGLIVALLNESFAIELDRPLENVDLFPLILQIISQQEDGREDLIVENEEGDLVMVFVDDTFTFPGISISISLIATEFTMSEAGGVNESLGIFSGMEIFSNFSVVLPNIDLGDVTFDGTVELDFSVQIDAEEAGLSEFINDIDRTFPKEVITFSGNVTQFLGKAAGLFAITEDDFDNLLVGEVIENPLDCFTSTFATASQLIAFGGDVDRIDARLTGFRDALINVVGDVVNALVFSYQSAILRGLETLLADQLFDPPTEILEVGVCPPLQIDVPGAPFDFSTSILQEVENIADAEFYEDLIAFVVSRDGEIQLDLIKEDNPIEFGLSLFSLDNFTQQIDFNITRVTIFGISPPEANAGSFEIFGQQLLQARTNLLTPDDRLQAQVDATIVINEPTSDFSSSRPPALFDDTASTNNISLSLEFDNIDAIVDILASLSQEAVLNRTLIDLIDTNCWVKDLQQPGGFSTVDVLSSVIEMKMTCDCESEILNQITETITQLEAIPDLNDDVQSVVDVVAGSFVDKFTGDRFQSTIEDAATLCIDGELDPIVLSGKVDGKKDPAAFTFIGFLAAILLFIFPVLFVNNLERKIKARTNPTILEEEKAPEQTRTEEETAIMLQKMKEFDDANVDRNENVPMYRNTHIPQRIRYLVFFLIFLNFALFGYGDFGVALEITLKGNLFEAPLPPQDFGSFSVITSTIDLYQNGAVGLAILIFLLALVWPYFKMIGLCLCYFTPPKCFGLKRRGSFLHFLDVFGKWSIVEVFFVVFLRLLFELSINSPRTDYLPSLDVYLVALLITPQLSFYTFGTAVLISILISNILVVYHEKIVRRNRDDLRNILHIGDTNMNVFTKLTMSDYLFLRNMKKVDGSTNYAYKFSPLGLQVFTGYTIFCMLMTLVANLIYIARVQYLGIARIFIDVSGQDSNPSFSVFSIVGDVVSKGIDDGDGGAIYFGILIVFLQFFAPLLVLSSTLMILYKGMSLKDASRHRVFRGCVAAWSTLEVFILAIAIAVIEVPAVADAITEDSCDFLVEFMSETLLPLGFVSEDDVENTCFGVKVEIPPTGYLYLLTIFFNLTNALIVLRLFDEMIKQRQEVSVRKNDPVAAKEQMDAIDRLDRNLAGGDNIVHYSRTISFLKSLGLVHAFPNHEGVKE